ncbi:MAG: SDR family oxidoreductase [Alphaproteobacteria bacterium]|nr:SDR family oxidoreductase [Alphaproteobacteria bacterium]
MTAGPLHDLTGRAALVTGASSGLGWHFAKVLARAGAKVAVAARRVERLETLASEIAAFDGRALPVALDVRDRASIEAAIDAAETELGPLAVVVNNAGIGVTRPFLDQSEEEWRGTLDTDLDGAWRVAQSSARRMVQHGQGGAIVNIASILGERSASQVSAYAAAKAGLIGLTRSMAVELARHAIRVNALAPGYIETDLNREVLSGPAGQALVKRIPLRRFGKPDDLDGALLLLASDAGRWMTGSVLVVDGGHTLSIV